ncbi:MAG: glucose-6-phosphate dehydrogenase [Gammaproteobacteria bacterium]|nr:glucose-6-phosphate dehydrogenase [Gammaproteobacteria bacterium]
MHSVPSFDLLLFGGTGDLALRKLLPALYFRHRDGDFPVHGRIVGLGRQPWTREEYLARVRESCAKFVPPEQFSEEIFTSFATRLDYLAVDARSADDFQRLAAYLKESAAEVRVFYLSTAPDLFLPICRHLADAGLVHQNARVVLEKPLGHDLASAQKINEAVGSVFTEPQIYRIDHYLGKEPVQNLLALRFGNALFEPLWSRGRVHDVQITIAEQLGVEGRGGFYDRAGALRDMVQNHLLQLLCITAMEPPSSIDPDAVRDEKLKVLRTLAPITSDDVAQRTVRGQYRAGAINDRPVCSYLEEPGIAVNSKVETFIALRADINNWRWSGVPFYLRTGKRLQHRLAEIVINFRDVPHSIFPCANGDNQGNQLVIQLQPEEGLKLYLKAKAPGDGMLLKPVYLNLDFSEQFKTRPMDAYERLLMDVLRGKLTLFMRRDELDAAWRWVEPILRAWEEGDEAPRPYSAGSWGPAAASALVARAGSAWREEH